MKIVNSIPDRVRAERLMRADQAALRELAVVMRCGNGVCQAVRKRDRPTAKRKRQTPRVCRWVARPVPQPCAVEAWTEDTAAGAAGAAWSVDQSLAPQRWKRCKW